MVTPLLDTLKCPDGPESGLLYIQEKQLQVLLSRALKETRQEEAERNTFGKYKTNCSLFDRHITDELDENTPRVFQPGEHILTRKPCISGVLNRL